MNNLMLHDLSKERLYGYARVSSKSQENNSSLETQKQELIDRGVPEENIRIEIGSAAASLQHRPVLQKLVEIDLKKDDCLIVTKLDRCSRDTLTFLQLQKKLLDQKINFIALDMPHSTDMAANEFIATSFAALATFENKRRKERQRKGIEAAKALGKYKGRKSVMTPKVIAKVKDLKENTNLSPADIAKIIGIGRTTVYRILKTKLGYVSNKLVKPTQSQHSEKGD